MIVRILGEGQFELDDIEVASLEKLDQELVAALDANDEATFRDVLTRLVKRVRSEGKPVPADRFVPSKLTEMCIRDRLRGARDRLEHRGASGRACGRTRARCDRGLPTTGTGHTGASRGGTRLARAHGRPQTARWRSGSRQVRRRSRGQAPRLSRPSRAHAQRLTRPSRTAGARHGAVDQNSVISSVSTRSCLYSAEFVIGSIAMSFAMLPVTFTFPCMNAALASSSFFWMRMASS